ncbi:MAG: chemotaxis protein CheX [Nocardioidaceae bacterium]
MTTITEHIQIIEIAKDIWYSMLALPLEETPPSMAETTEEPDWATSSIHITGETDVSIIMSFSADLAKRVTSAMFDMAVEELGEEEIADACGEMVNIIGGNLKALLPEPSELSLPTVSLGGQHHVTIPGAHVIEQVDLDSLGDRMRITLLTGREH